MKKFKFKSIFAIMMSAAMLCSACGSTEESNKLTADTIPFPSVETEKKEESKYETTGKYIVQNGKTDYKIVVQKDASALISVAASELQYFFEEATGIILPIIDDEGLTYGEQGKYLSIGENNLSVGDGSANLTIDKTVLKNSGLRVQTKGETVFMYGGSDQGSLYAVYDFLKDAFHYEFYYEDVYELDENVTELPLRKYDITNVPDFDFRAAHTGKFKANDMLAYRYYENANASTDMLIHGTIGQSGDGQLLRYYIPIVENSTYTPFFEAYPELAKYKPYTGKWQSVGSGSPQVCFNAQGDAESYEKLVECLAEILEDSLIKDTDKNHKRFVFGGSDDTNYCTCKTCKEKKEEYGSDAGSFIKLCNDVKVKVDAWLQEDGNEGYYREGWSLEPLVYHGYKVPPIKNGKATITCVEGVKPYYAPIGYDWTREYDDPANALYKEYLDGWGKVAGDNQITCWYYGTNFNHYLMPFNGYESVQTHLQATAKVGCSKMMIEIQDNSQGKTTGFDMLKNWLYSKMMWDADCDITALIDSWHKAVYGDASSIMSDLFTEVRINMYEMAKNGYGGIYLNPKSDKYYSQSLLERWINKVDEAYAVLENTNATDAQKEMVVAEKVSYLWLMIEIYGDNLPSGVSLAYKNEFFRCASYAGISNYSQHDLINNLKSSYLG